MGKHKTANEIFDENVDNICLLHLIAMKELPTKATTVDATKFFWQIKEDCTVCPYNENCLACLFTARLDND